METHLLWGHKVKGQGHESQKNIDGVDLYTLVSAGLFRFDAIWYGRRFAGQQFWPKLSGLPYLVVLFFEIQAAI